MGYYTCVLLYHPNLNEYSLMYYTKSQNILKYFISDEVLKTDEILYSLLQQIKSSKIIQISLYEKMQEIDFSPSGPSKLEEVMLTKKISNYMLNSKMINDHILELREIIKFKINDFNEIVKYNEYFELSIDGSNKQQIKNEYNCILDNLEIFINPAKKILRVINNDKK